MPLASCVDKTEASADVMKMGQGLTARVNGLINGEAIRRAEACEALM